MGRKGISMSEEQETYISDADADGEQEFTFNLDGDDDKDEKENPIIARLAEIEAANRALEAKLAAVEAQKQTYLTPVQNIAPSVPQRTGIPTDPQQRALLEKNLEESFVQKGIGATLLGLAEANQNIAYQAAVEKYLPIAAATVKGAIAAYKVGSGMDAATKKEFDAIVKGIPDSLLAQVDTSNLDGYLETVHNMAAGQAARKKVVEPAPRSAPMYLSGSVGGGTNGKVRQVTVGLNGEEQALAKALKEAGLTDAQVMKAIKDERSGGIKSVRERV